MISSPHMLREESNAYNVCIMGRCFPIPLFLTLGLQLREPVAKSSPLGPTACTLASQLHLPPPSHVFTLSSFRSEAELKTRHSSFKIELPGPTDGVFSHMLLLYGAVHLQCWIAFGALYTEKKKLQIRQSISSYKPNFHQLFPFPFFQRAKFPASTEAWSEWG